MKFTFVFFAIFIAQLSAQALLKQQKAYYGAEFYNSVLNKAHDEELKTALKNILKSAHTKNENDFDKLVESCDSQKNCYTQTSIGYDGARSFLFGKFYLVKLDASNYGINEKYCDRIYQKDDFKRGSQPGPGIVPDSTIINVEHTWPQSRFSGKYPKDLQKADLHHLFPTDSKMNSLRGNNPFGEVVHDNGPTACSASRFGSGKDSSLDVFEPPQAHKGHVARALFYFSVRYDLPIRPSEEVILKKWNKENPVDAEEMARNEEIFKTQGNRNPFVDYPELADAITDF